MADIVTSRIFTDGERGITAQKLNDIVGSSVIQPAFYTSKPTAGSADPADIALILKAGAYAQVPVSTLAGSATQAQIWSTRLRSFNAIGNPNFEVDQRNVGGIVTSPANAAGIVDRWFNNKAGTMTVNARQVPLSSGDVVVPGTSFCISRTAYRVTLTGQEASLGASDVLGIYQNIEGPYFRELQYDVHSLSLLVRSSVAGLKFAVTLRDPSSSVTLTNLCTLSGTASTWTLCTLPNLPIFSSSGVFSTVPGTAGYQIVICLAAGTSATAPAAGTWQTGTFSGAPGMSNFCAQPVNSYFDIAMVQHEPGAVCSTLMDKPFTQNYAECLRYYCKSWNYSQVVGSSNSAAPSFLVTPGGLSFPQGNATFPVPMAIPPTVTMYALDGTINNCTMYGGAKVGVSAPSRNQNMINSFTLATNQTAGWIAQINYTADTGW